MPTERMAGGWRDTPASQTPCSQMGGGGSRRVLITGRCCPSRAAVALSFCVALRRCQVCSHPEEPVLRHSLPWRPSHTDVLGAYLVLRPGLQSCHAVGNRAGPVLLSADSQGLATHKANPQNVQQQARTLRYKLRTLDDK